MSNFYKPSYSRGQKRSALQSRDSTTRNNIVYKTKNQHVELDNQPLIINKRNVSTAQHPNDDNQDLMFTSNVIHKKQPSNRFTQTAKQGTRKIIDRPQSKQEPRNRGWNNSGLLLKSALVDNNNRPQTSKGQRPRPYYRQKVEDVSKRRNSLQSDDFKMEKKNYDPKPMSSVGNRKGSQTNRIEFKTSIDPEFLSLFAN